MKSKNKFLIILYNYTLIHIEWEVLLVKCTFIYHYKYTDLNATETVDQFAISVEFKIFKVWGREKVVILSC